MQPELSSQKCYLRFDDQGNTKIVGQEHIVPGFSYRKVNVRKVEAGKGLFTDETFDANQELAEVNYTRKIILVRMLELYRQMPPSEKPPFFPKTQQINLQIQEPMKLPSCITEVGIFPMSHYKSFFITQNFASNGQYEIIANEEGHFQIQIIDDYIPVYADNLDPIWNTGVNNPWLLLLLKVWAKQNGSYFRIKMARPFSFLECFSNSNWKFYNIAKEGLEFLNTYTGKVEIGKFVLKTKNNSSVSDSGLIPNCAGYEIAQIKQAGNSKNLKENKWNLTLRSTLPNKWSGKLSVLDKKLTSSYKAADYTLTLQKHFMLNHFDFLNLFSSAFIASKRDKHNYFSDYYHLKVPPLHKHAFYLKFQINQDGFFDFCLKQPQSNKKQMGRRSVARLDDSARMMTGENERYLKCKFILVKLREEPESERQVTEYFPLDYEAYQIEYLQGYNKGDARFENIQKGKYILRLKTETFRRESSFVVNYTCNSLIKIQEVQLPKSEKSKLLRESMASFFDRIPHYLIDKNTKDGRVGFGNLFVEAGYGFVGVQLKKSCYFSILIQINPLQLQRSGYKLKSQFKNLRQLFSVHVRPGQQTTIIFKRNSEQAEWPPKGIEFYRDR